MLADEEGQILEAHSVSAGLDYPPSGLSTPSCVIRARGDYIDATDGDALAAFHELSRLEGIIPALETSHAFAWLLAEGETGQTGFDIVCLSGRGDKDLAEVLGLDS